MPNQFGIVANVLSDRVLRTGAKVWVTLTFGTCGRVAGLNKGGRKTEKVTHYKRLTNFRAAWIPEHMRGDIFMSWETKADASEWAASVAAIYKDVRYFNRDGTKIMKDGISQNEAFKRAGLL